MSTTIPPARKIAAPLDWETATVEDVWRASDLGGVAPSAALATVEQLASRNT